ncbi:Mu-like prophage major head subunit gpT family protein [Paenibacillus melissococcoides]|nr:Mu-like prophage major head subunit gpT family protein [Paenibacillus melissococcoides]CAH8720529.1 Mu-like prophage major head subunit gpT family protein [Paenibacillus melissococcoides]
MSLVDDGGKSLKLVPNLLVVSPANEMGRKILYADQIDGTTNTFKSTRSCLSCQTWPRAQMLGFALHDKAAEAAHLPGAQGG